MSYVEIKDSLSDNKNHKVTSLSGNKPFSDQPVKNKQEVYEKLIKMSRNSDHTTGNILDYLYHQNITNILL